MEVRRRDVEKLRAMTWIFDVDGCVVDSLLGSSLRPGARQILERLRSEGHEVIWWSAGGIDHARGRAERFGVAGLVDRFAEKEGRDADGRYLVASLSIVLDQSIFVDDRPEDLPREAEVLAVPPYLIENPRDQGLAAIAARAGIEL